MNPLDWYRSLPYYITGAVTRFVKVTFLSALVAGGLLLTHAISLAEALISIQVAAGGALLAAADKLRREWGIESGAGDEPNDPVVEG